MISYALKLGVIVAIVSIIISLIVFLVKTIRRYTEKKDAERKRSSQLFLEDMKRNRKQRVDGYIHQYDEGKEPNIYWNKRRPK